MFTIHDLRSTLSIRLRGYRIGINESFMPYHFALQMDLIHQVEKNETTFQMDCVLIDFGSKSIRTESITEKKETTFQMDSVLIDFRGRKTNKRGNKP